MQFPSTRVDRGEEEGPQTREMAMCVGSIVRWATRAHITTSPPPPGPARASGSLQTEKLLPCKRRPGRMRYEGGLGRVGPAARDTGPPPACRRDGLQALHVEMATGTYSSGIGHPYPYPLELSFTRRVTRTRTRVGKCFHTRTRRVIYTRRVTRTRKAYPRITYKYHIFI